MKKKFHPNYVSQVKDDLSSPWPLLFIIGLFVGLYFYLEKGYSGYIPSVFAILLVLSLAVRTKTYNRTICPDCGHEISVDISFKAGDPFTAECSRCQVNWDLGKARRPWVKYNDDVDGYD